MNPATETPAAAPAPAPPAARPARPAARRDRDRDRELVRYVGRHGLVRIAHVMKAMEAGRTVTYDRVAACVEAGLLERLELVRSEPGLLHATRDGLRFAGLGLPVAKVSPGGVDHLLRCATTARLLEKHYEGARVLTERELILAEQIAGRPIASAEVGGRRQSRVRRHRPDLAVLTKEAVIAIEVELTPKAPGRLYELMRAWRWAVASGKVKEVHYLCAPGQTRRAVERAVVKVQAEKFITVGKAVSR
jgi:hypothetical protein